jgi:hypothetical protein
VEQHCKRSDCCPAEERSVVVLLDETGEPVSRKCFLCCDVGRQSAEVDNAACLLEVYVRLEGQNSSAALYSFVSDHVIDVWPMCLP